MRVDTAVIALTVGALSAAFVLGAWVFTPGVRTDAESAAFLAAAGASVPVILLAGWASRGVRMSGDRQPQGYCGSSRGGGTISP